VPGTIGFVAVLALAFLSAGAKAGEAAAPDPREIVVTGKGLPVAPGSPAYDAATLERDALLAAASGRIEDALASVAGFQQFRRSDSRSANPSAQGVTLRALGGNATSRTLVLLDGVPQADPFFGYIPLSALAPEFLSGARVTRGGGAGAFGSGTVAGTIELSSAGPADLGRGTLGGAIDDRGETTFSAAVAPRLGSGFAVASGRWDRGQGFWTTPASQRDPLSVRARYESWSAGLRGVAPLAPDLELQAHVGAFSDQRTLRFAGADSFSSGQDASLRLVGRGPWGVEALAYLQARDFGNVVIGTNVAAKFRKTVDQYATPSTGWGGKLELRPPVGTVHVLRLGADLRAADGHEAEASYSATTGAVTQRRQAGGRNTDLGLYAEDDWRLGALTLTAGARADRWAIAGGFYEEATPGGTVTLSQRFAARTGWYGSYRGGAVLRAVPGLSLRASAYGGMRLPTLNELYRPFTVFPVKTQANPALGNERLAGWEVGADWIPVAGLKLTATGFDNRVKGAIANVTIGANLRERRNVDAIHARGAELGLDWHSGPIALAGSLALTEAKVEASGAAAALDGKRPAQTPRIAASATLAWNPGPASHLALTLRHTGAQFEDDLETDVLPAATTLAATAQVPLVHGFNLILRGENLTDATVITRNQGGSLDLGTPRTLWIGLSAQLR